MAHETTLDIPKLTGIIARTYAQTLFDLAEADGVIDEIVDELTQLIDLMEAEPQLAQFFQSRSIASSRRAVSIEKMLKGKVSDLLYRFLQVLNDKGRLNQLVGITVAFGQLVKAKQGEVDVDLFTATSLSEERLNQLTERLSQALGRTALIHPHTDESMIGGLKIQVGDRLIDGSLATQLRRMMEQMAEAGREAARERAAQMIEEDS